MLLVNHSSMGCQEWVRGVCFTAALGHPTAEFGGDLHNVAPSQKEENTKIPFPEPAELRGGSCTQRQLHPPIKNPNLSIVAEELNPKIKTSTTQPPPHPPALLLCRVNVRDAGGSQPTHSTHPGVLGWAGLGEPSQIPHSRAAPGWSPC